LQHFSLTSASSKHLIVIVNRTFDQKRSLCPGSAVTGDCREISRRVGSDNLSLDIEGTMKIHHLLVIVGMAIGFALPAFAQQKDTVDPQVSEQLSALSIGTAGIEAWSNGEWSTTLKGEKFGPVDAKGNWVEIYRREGDTWRKRLDMWNVTPAPPATAATTPSATPTPSNK
jgi:hypothetical protein